MLVLVVVVEFDLVVVTLPLALVVVVVFDVVVVVLPLLGAIVGAGVAVFAGVTFAGLLALPLAALFDAGSGQAAPNKPNVKTAERAITFFISIKFSCLLQRMYIYLFV